MLLLTPPLKTIQKFVYNTLPDTKSFNSQTGDKIVLNKLFITGFMVSKETDEFAKLQKYRAVCHHFLSKESRSKVP